MERKINLAWALRVNHYQILARLEAYIETRVPITVLRVCIARTTSPSLPKLPSEIVAIITSALQDLEYKSKLPEFLKLQMCLEGRCLPDAHFSQAMFGDAYSPSPDAEGEGESVKRVPGWVKVKEYLKRKCAPPGSSTWGQLDDSEDLEAGRRIIQAWDKKENEEIHQRVVSEHLRGIKYNVGYMTLYRKVCARR